MLIATDNWRLTNDNTIRRGNADGRRDGIIRWLSLVVSIVTLFVTVAIWLGFDSGLAEFQFVERVAWIPAFGIDYYVDLFKKVREQPEWKEFMKSGAFTQTFMSGDEYKTWVANAAELHKKLMTEAGFLAQ